MIVYVVRDTRGHPMSVHANRTVEDGPESAEEALAKYRPMDQNLMKIDPFEVQGGQDAVQVESPVEVGVRES